MKRMRNVAVKNVTGSLCGGILGILAFGYIHPIVLPIGCLLGVLIGWWYEIIVQKLFAGWINGIERSISMKKEFCQKRMAVKNYVLHINYMRPFIIIINRCRNMLHNIFAKSRAISQWMRARPMCKIYFTHMLSSIATFFITSLWFVPVSYYFIVQRNEMMPHSDLQTLLDLASMIVMVIVVFSLIAPFIETPINREDFYRAWNQYEQRGMIKHFLFGIIYIISLQVFSVYILIGCGVWFICVGGIFGMLILAPIWLVVGMIKGFYYASKEAGHWLCLGTTLFVTVLSVWLMHPYFVDVRVLWIVALITGVVSALVTETIRRIIVHFCDEITFCRNVIQYSFGEQTNSCRALFKKVTTFVGKCYLLPFSHVLQK